MTRRQVRTRGIELLELVDIEAAASRIDDYPHQFSGGMRQRIPIAMAIELEPDLLTADAPTPAPGVPAQAPLMRPLHDPRTPLDLAVLTITHALAVATNDADRANHSPHHT